MSSLLRVSSSSVLLVLGAVVGSFSACTDVPPTFDEVEPEGGVIQPDGNGVAVSEDEACATLAAALDERSAELECERDAFDCPAALRPAGGCEATYDAGTVEACVGVIEEYERCDDFTSKRCIVTAFPAEERCSDDGPGTGGGGLGGQSSTGGTANGGMGGA